MTVSLTARNARLPEIVEILKSQHAAKVDIVAPARALRSEQGRIRIAGTSVFDEAGDQFVPTEIADGHIASSLGIPAQYLRKLREQRPDLYDANVNGWIHGTGVMPREHADGTVEPYVGAEPDGRTFTARCFSGDPGEPGVMRGLLSDRFGIFDNLDVLMSALEGARAADAQLEVVKADLSERRMTVRFAAPSVTALAPRLLRGYRSPTTGWGLDRLSQNYSAAHLGWDASKGETPPVVFAGFDLTNGETGGAAFSIEPVFTVAACKNGLKITTDGLRRIHLGGKQDEGLIRWSEGTMRKELAVIKSRTEDAVATFLDVEYMTMRLDEIETKATKALKHPAEAIKVIAKELHYTDAQQAGILDHFITGGQPTAGGVLQAVTSWAQVVADPDEAFDLEGSAMRALELAFAM